MNEANQIAIMRALSRWFIETGLNHVDPITYPEHMHSERLPDRIATTQAHLDAKLNQWRDNVRQRPFGNQQTPGSGPD